MEARGLWIDLLCLMHQGEPYGHLTFKGYSYATATDVATALVRCINRVTGADVRVIKRVLIELEEAKIFSKTENGIIFSRRMVQDEKTRQLRANAGFKALENPNVPKARYTYEDDLEGGAGWMSSKVEVVGIDGQHYADPSPSSSSSSSSSKKKNKSKSRGVGGTGGEGSVRGAGVVGGVGGEGVLSVPEKNGHGKIAPAMGHEEWLAHLQAMDAYRHLNVRVLYSRMVAWCEAKRKEPSRLRFVNWLNREDPPMSETPAPPVVAAPTLPETETIIDPNGRPVQFLRGRDSHDTNKFRSITQRLLIAGWSYESPGRWAHPERGTLLQGVGVSPVWHHVSLDGEMSLLPLAAVTGWVNQAFAAPVQESV